MQQISFLDSKTKWPPAGLLRVNREISLARGLEMLIIPSIGSTSKMLVDLALGLDVTISGGAIGIDNEIGPVFSTTGLNQYFAIPKNYIAITSPTFSVNFWFRSIQQTANYGICSWSDINLSTEPFVLIQLNNDTLRFYADADYRETSQTLTNNVLYNIGISRNYGNIWSFYLNGKLLSTYTDDGTPTYLNHAVWIYFGIGYQTSYYGYFGQSAFWNRELTATEFQALYNPQTRWSLVQPIEPPRFWNISTGEAGGITRSFGYIF